MMKLEALNCPNCGAPLRIQANQELTLCVYCDTTIRATWSDSGEASLIRQTTLQPEDARQIKNLLLAGNREQAIELYQRVVQVSQAEAQKAIDELASNAAFQVIFSQRLNFVGILMLFGYTALLGWSIWAGIQGIIFPFISVLVVLLTLFLSWTLYRGLFTTIKYLGSRSGVATVLQYAQIGKLGSTHAFRALVSVQTDGQADFQTQMNLAVGEKRLSKLQNGLRFKVRYLPNQVDSVLYQGVIDE